MLPIKKIVVSSFVSLFVLAFTAVPSLAASAFVFPASGIIKDPTFLVSIFVESTATEPAIAGANVKLSYPTSVNVVKIDDGDFDTTLEKNNDTNTHAITVNAVNNAGNYKTGKVKLASVEFNTAATSGTVNLNIIAAESSISGEDGSQLLTDSVNGVFTIQVTPTGTGGGGDTTGGTGTGTDTTGTGTTETETEVPETGTTTNLLVFIILSASLIGLGILSLRPKTVKK